MGWEFFPAKSCLVIRDPSIAFLHYLEKAIVLALPETVFF